MARCARQTNYAPVGVVTENDRAIFRLLWQARCADTGNIANLGLFSTKNGSLSGVFKRLRRLEESGYLDSYRLPMPVYDPFTDASGKEQNRLREQLRRIWTLKGRAIRELQKTGEDEFASTTSPYTLAQRNEPNHAVFAHEVFALWATQTLEASLTDPDAGVICKIKASEKQTRRAQATADGKTDFYDFSGNPGGSKLTPDWSLEVTDQRTGKRKLVLLEYDQGYYRKGELRRKLDTVNDTDAYWMEVSESYDAVELWLVGANSTVRERHKRWLADDVGGDFNHLSEKVKFKSLREVMGVAYDEM
jgi:hypothetical protein